MNRIILVVAFALSLIGCASLPGPVGDVLRIATTTIENPVDEVDIYRVKNTYAAALELADEYRRYCWSMSYARLMVDPVGKKICQSRRGVVRAFQSAQVKARSALNAAEKFVAENPTISAASVVRSAWDAVSDFRRAVPGAAQQGAVQ